MIHAPTTPENLAGQLDAVAVAISSIAMRAGITSLVIDDMRKYRAVAEEDCVNSQSEYTKGREAGAKLILQELGG